MRFWQYVGILTLASTATVAGASLYGATQVTRPRRSHHRDDPAAWGLPAVDVALRTEDGVGLRCWLVRAPAAQSAVIIAHGHGGNRHTSLAHASLLFPRFSLLIPDLRGHGDSEGRATSVGYLERLDLIAAARYLKALGYEKIGILGISMGAATAILAAAESQLIDAVVADSSFALLRNAVREAARLRGYPDPITRPLAFLSCQTAAWWLRYPMQAGDPLGAVGAISPRPLLIIHGEADTLIPVENARLLYAAAAEPRELWILPAVGHARALEADGQAYQRRIRTFLDRWLA